MIARDEYGVLKIHCCSGKYTLVFEEWCYKNACGRCLMFCEEEIDRKMEIRMISGTFIYLYEEEEL